MPTNMYLQFEGPNMERIEVLSWSHGFAQPSGPTRQTGEQATHSTLSITKYVDSTSGVLLKHCWSGHVIQKATLSCYRAGSDGKPVRYLTVLMEPVVIANISLSAGAGDVPVENVSLDYGKVTYEYIDQRTGESRTASHDLVTREVG
jgi:type VI secretion system secreted protein Hcp